MDFPQPKTTLVKFNDKLWAIDQEMVRSYIILGEEKALLWDTGASPCDMMELVREATDLPMVVVNSHGDGDHTANNSQFPEVYIHPDEMPTLRFFKNENATKFLPVTEGMVFDLGGRELEVFHIPGHTPGSICLLDRKNRMLFSGDTVQRDSVFLFGGHRQPKKFPAALEKIKALSGEFDTVWPSHGECPVKPDTIDGLMNCYQAAKEGRLQGEEPPMPMPPGPGSDQPKCYRLEGCSVLL